MIKLMIFYSLKSFLKSGSLSYNSSLSLSFFFLSMLHTKYNIGLVSLSDSVNAAYYLHPRCSILGTMDRSRFTGLPLSVQQMFRWVHFRTDQEPLRTLLHRHLYRRLVHKYKGMVLPHEDMVRNAHYLSLNLCYSIEIDRVG